MIKKKSRSYECTFKFARALRREYSRTRIDTRVIVNKHTYMERERELL